MAHTIKNYFLFLILAFSIGFFVPTSTVHGQAIDMTVEQELFGWAWSDTIGWISMNCANLDECGTSNYVVRRIPNPLNPSDGQLVGYAWSEHIGWIQFGGLSPTPPGAGQANLMSIEGNTVARAGGWARALAGQNFDDGWDGWILLRRDTDPLFGIRFSLQGSNAGEAIGDSYAWGSEVVGWVDFSGVTLGVPVDSPVNVPSATITGDDCPIPVGASTCQTTINWTVENADNPNIVGPTGLVSTSENGPQTVTLQRGSSIFQARNGSDVLASVTVRAECVLGAIWDADLAQCVAELPNLRAQNFSRTQQGGFNFDTGIANQRFSFGIRNIGATTTDAAGVNSDPNRIHHRLVIEDVSNDPSIYVSRGGSGARLDTSYDGSANRDGSLSGQITPNQTRTVNYNTVPLMFGHYRVTVTADPNPPNRIQEEDESNNSITQIVTILPPQFTPGLTVTPRIIRSGEDAELEWNGIPPWVTCVVSGAGLPGGSLPVLGSSGESGSFTLANRTSSSRYQMVCTEPSTGATFTSPEARLEVLPRLEEI